MLAEPYKHLRAQALQLNAAEVGSADPTFGVLMETGYPEAVLSLLALANGTASLYFSNGGGIIGSGQREGPAVAARSLVAFAAHNLRYLAETADYPLPQPGRTRFYVLTANGWFRRMHRSASLARIAMCCRRCSMQLRDSSLRYVPPMGSVSDIAAKLCGGKSV